MAEHDLRVEGVMIDPLLTLARPRHSQATLFLRRLFERRVSVVGLAIIVALILCAIFAPILAPQDPYRQSLYTTLKGPTPEHWLGTDELGRDLLSRVIWGSRVSVEVGLISVTVTIVAGSILGLAAGYWRGLTDTLIMRSMDALIAFPTLVLALGIAAALGPNLRNVMIAIGIVMVPTFARLVRGQVLAVRELEYVQAARAVGARDRRIILAHVWPNVTSPLIVQASLQIGFSILSEASLSFLGVGVQPPTPTWGSTLRAGYTYLNTAPLMSMAPGLCIMLVVMGFNFLGDGLRDALDPRLKGA